MYKKVAIATDSNTVIGLDEAKTLGVFILPMPFMVDGKSYHENIDLHEKEFFDFLQKNCDVSTSQPALGEVMEFWNNILKEYDELVYIPMSSGLSKSCETAIMLSQEDEYKDKVYVCDNQRISVTQRQSVLDAIKLKEKGLSAKEICDKLYEHKFDSSIYIMVDTLKYLCKGGRVTPAGAAFGKFLGIKPVLTIQGEKLDAYKKVRGTKKAITTMIEAIKNDIANRFGNDNSKMHMEVAYTIDTKAEDNLFMANELFELVKKEFPNCIDYVMCPLSLVVSCHIGPGALAVAVSKEIDD